MTIAEMLSDVLRREGWPEVTDRASDLGGLTKGGVTIRSYNAWRSLHGERALTRDEFAHITEQDARTFFEDEFVAPFKFILDEDIFVFLSDWSVNAGPDDPARALQAELKKHGVYTGALDGIPGPMTRAGWARVRTTGAVEDIEISLIRARTEFHIARAFDPEVLAFLKSHPRSQLVNLKGWLRRTLSFLN